MAAGGCLVVADLVAIPGESLVTGWGRIAAQMMTLADISGGRLTVADIARAVQERKMQLWGACEGERISLMLTELLNHPGQRDAHIISATGQNADQWLPLWEKFEEWVRSENCAVVTATCRLGWKKVLKPLGFDEVACVLEKRL